MPDERPDSLPSHTTKVRTDHGNMYVTIAYQNRQPWEVWVQIGKAGSCERAFCEALGRALAMALQHGATLDELVHHLQGIKCQPIGDGAGFVHSPADGIAKIFREADHAITSG